MAYHYQPHHHHNNAAYNIQVQELNEAHDAAPHPQGVGVQLKRHQLTLLARALHMENHRIYTGEDGVTATTAPQPGHEATFMQTRVGVLCDQVGSGKSYVVLALVLDATPLSVEPLIVSYSGGLVTTSGLRPELTRLDTNVLVIPHNLVHQWSVYVATFKPDLRHAIVARNKQLDKLLETGLAEYRLVVVTSALYNRLAEHVNDRNESVRRVIFDEVDNLSIPSCAQINADFHWFVTASYGNLLYPRGFNAYDYARGRYVTYAVGLPNSGFIKNLFTDLRYQMGFHRMRQLFLRNSAEYVASSVRLPEIITRTVQCRAHAALGILSGIADDQIINCLHANDLAGAVQLINPGHRGSEDSVVALVLDRFHRSLRNINVQIAYTQQLEFDRPEDKQAELKKLEDKGKELEAKIAGIQARINEASTCPICYDDIERKTVVSCCSNAFCFKCLSTWLVRNNKCPTCRAPMSLQQNLFVVDDSVRVEQAKAEEEDHTNAIHETNTKLQNLENIIRTTISDNASASTIGSTSTSGGSDARLLVFSSYETPFHQIAEVLRGANVPFAYLKGNNYVISRIVEDYKAGRIRVLLINTTYYGSGLNLENTTDIIMFHKLDTEIEKQVIGRAQRCGRSDALHVWYLLHANETPATVAAPGGSA